MKTRDEVRPEMTQGLRFVGYGLMILGFLGGVLLTITPTLGLNPPGISWLIALGMIGAGIGCSFPRSAFGHVIAAHLDGLLDRVIGPDKPNNE